MKKELIIYTDPKSPISEIFRTLRTNILFMDTNGESKTILLTSTLPGEGKSWMSSNLATAFAQTGKKIILIDSDMRKGRQYSIFDLLPTPGLSNYLTGVDINESVKKEKKLKDYIQKTEIENLDVMTAGNVPPNPSELLSSNKMINLLKEVKKLYDIVIIDGTPCQLVADSLILSRIVDSTILVASHKYTKKKDLDRVVTSIKNVGGKIFGVILNKVPIPIKKYEQSYYYGSSSESKKDENKNNKNENENVKKEIADSDKKEKVATKKKTVDAGKKDKVDAKKETTKGDKKEKTVTKKETAKKDTKPKTTKNDKKENLDAKKKIPNSNKKEVAKDNKKKKTNIKEKSKVTNNAKKIEKQADIKENNNKQLDIKENFTKIEKTENVEVVKSKRGKIKDYVVKKEIVVPLFEEIMGNS